MPRFLVSFTVFIGLFFGTANAHAEMIHPGFVLGTTDNLSKMINPGFVPDTPGISSRMAGPPALIYTPTNPGHDMYGMPLTPAPSEASQNAVWNFWTYMLVLSALFLSSAYLLGRQVIKRGWKVGYTRKAQALALYFLPYIAMQGPSPYSMITTASISLGSFILLLMMLSAPVRNRIPALATAFASIDRPEDRPFTLTWLITSVIAAWGVICLWIWAAPETIGYLFVALFISGVGDAIAEPVGLYFGRHKYQTRALGTDRTYIRTYEGSAAVFASGVIAVLLVHGLTIDSKALAALALFPIAGTLAEAKSPHTWDQPFIIGCCALVAVGLSAI